MPSRKKKKKKIVYFTPGEWKIVCRNAERCEMRVGTYIQKMAIFGEINVYDFKRLAEFYLELVRIGTNINQIAHVINETRSVYKKDIQNIEKLVKRIRNSYNKYITPLNTFIVHDDDENE